MSGALTARRIADAVLPERNAGDAEVVVGEFHDVVLFPGHAVVKIARGRAVEHLARRAGLLGALANVGLPFAVPRPLSGVLTVDGCAAVALSWVPGAPAPAGSGDPVRLRQLLAVLADIDVTPTSTLARWLDAPHAYAGRSRWTELMLGDVLDRLPPTVREQARARVQAAIDLPPVPPRLVHGDLAGHNLRWHSDGCLAAVIDWDLACAFDPAVDAACLGWFGWDTVAAAVDPTTYARTRTWAATFRLESIAAAIDNGEADDVIADRAQAAARELHTTPTGR